MNKVSSNWQLPVYQVIGPIIRVHWDYSSYETDQEWGESQTMWEAKEVVIPLNADRETFIKLVSDAGGNGEELANGWFNNKRKQL
jgi:hypothetical protein